MSRPAGVLFLCIHNSGRSLAAKVLFDHYAQGGSRSRSAGSEPGDQLNPSVVAILEERGLDVAKEFPKPLTDELAREADVIVTMGCGDTCPVLSGEDATSTGSCVDPAGKSDRRGAANRRRHRPAGQAVDGPVRGRA